MKNNEEDLWGILVLIFEADDVFYSADYIAKLCYEAGFTDIEQIRSVFFSDILPVCLFPALFAFGISFNKEWTVPAVRNFKHNIFSQLLMGIILLFVPKKEFKIFIDQVEKELAILKQAPTNGLPHLRHHSH